MTSPTQRELDRQLAHVHHARDGRSRYRAARRLARLLRRFRRDRAR